MLENLLAQIVKSIVIAVLYFETTNANDTTLRNIISFTIFYIAMIYGATLAGIEQNVITSAFLTKTVFTLVDERIKKKEEKEEKK